MNTRFLFVAVLCLAGASSNASAQWWGTLGPVRNVLGSQLRQASPAGYQVLLGINRSVPPQVKNGGGFIPAPYYGRVAHPYGYGGNPYQYQADLAYWRSIPPQVKNEWAKQARLAAMPVAQPYEPAVAPQPPAAPTGALPPVGPSGAPGLLPNYELPAVAR